MASVEATLASGVGVGSASPFPLGIHGMPNPTREFVEGWIIRKEAATTKLEEKRWRYGFAVAVLGIVVAIVIWWFQ